MLFSWLEQRLFYYHSDIAQQDSKLVLQLRAAAVSIVQAILHIKKKSVMIE
jgi:hypothetical protein